MCESKQHPGSWWLRKKRIKYTYKQSLPILFGRLKRKFESILTRFNQLHLIDILKFILNIPKLVIYVILWLLWFCEICYRWLCKLALIDISKRIGYLLASITLLLALLYFRYESSQRRKVERYQAWQVINSAQGKPGSGGRIDALQDLVKDGISLSGVDVSNAYLSEVQISGAVLKKANFSGTYLWRADLSGAILTDADFSKAYLSEVNLSGAYIKGADLSESNLSNADLSESYLNKANLRNVKEWRSIWKIEGANIWGIENPPEGFVEWAREHGAVEIRSIDEWDEWKRKRLREKEKKEVSNLTEIRPIPGGVAR